MQPRGLEESLDEASIGDAAVRMLRMPLDTDAEGCGRVLTYLDGPIGGVPGHRKVARIPDCLVMGGVHDNVRATERGRDERTVGKRRWVLDELARPLTVDER